LSIVALAAVLKSKKTDLGVIVDDNFCRSGRGVLEELRVSVGMVVEGGVARVGVRQEHHATAVAIIKNGIGRCAGVGAAELSEDVTKDHGAAIGIREHGMAGGAVVANCVRPPLSLKTMALPAVLLSRKSVMPKFWLMIVAVAAALAL